MAEIRPTRSRTVSLIALGASLLLGAAGCQGNDRIASSGPVPVVAGDWTTTSEQPLTTLITGLKIEQQGAALRARMSFSGVQLEGEGEATATGISLAFPRAGGTTRLVGTLEGGELLHVTLTGVSPAPPASTLRRAQ